MHIAASQTASLDETAPAVDLGQSAAELVFLSFTDSDLAIVAAAWEAAPGASLRLANLAQLKHPYSVDLYVESVVSKARVVLVRLLGGLDYWRYGVEELAAAARARGIHLAIVPGDERADPRCEAASTLPPDALDALWRHFQEGGPANAAAVLRIMARWPERIAEPLERVAPFGRYEPGCRRAIGEARALIVFYRSIYLSADTAPIDALADALAARGFCVEAVYVTSLKDPAAARPLAALIGATRPDVILNATAFSARGDDGASVLDGADAPVFQAILSGGSAAQWREAPRGLSATDLAMNVVLPEIDGRIGGPAISFKAPAARRDDLEFTRLRHAPEPSRIAHLAALAESWAVLRRTPRADRRLACILSDYPAKGGRTGYAVGLDTPASVAAIADRLRAEGYAVDAVEPRSLMAQLTSAPPAACLTLADYTAALALQPVFAASVAAAWGPPADDPDFSDGAFCFRLMRRGAMIVAVQPDRGRPQSRKADYHDAALPPRHGYVAFYLWLREQERVHAIVHCGTHGTLEWLPGKAVALSAECAPEAVLGPVPVIYPFIVNNPGEAAQARRRIAAVTIGHLTPPLVAAGAHGPAAAIEGLLDEYAQAQTLDPRRARLLADMIYTKAEESGLLRDAGIGARDTAGLAQLDAWLCDVKDMRIGDGLHVFGAALRTDAACFSACDEAEMAGLVRALDGRFTPPGPAGAPSRGRLDVLPTGRNLYGVDPRAVPTRAAWELGRATAEAVLTRYAQDHGDWPRAIVLDLWASATMRTGGDDLAQALALIGARPLWDHAGDRVNGFEILPPGVLGRPRVDATLRISGLFRDVFPTQIALFDAAARAIAALDEADDENPLAQARRRAGAAPFARVFGAAPGAYGLGLSRVIAEGDWATRDDLGAAYLAATPHAYGAHEAPSAAFAERVACADAYLHVQDLPDQDVLDADALASHEGGFAAAAASLGRAPALYHVDAAMPGAPRVRTLAQELARVLRGRAVNPRWIAGQMRHGFRGAAEIAETVGNLYAFAAMTDVVANEHFDLMYDATCGAPDVRDFLERENPQAAAAIAATFDEAITRGLWLTRRNSVGPALGEMRGAA